MLAVVELALQGCAAITSQPAIVPAQSTTNASSTAPAAASSAHSLPAGLSVSPSASTIVATYTGTSAGASTLACGTSAGLFDHQAVDNGTASSSPTRQNIVAGLLPSTTYFCQMTLTADSGSSPLLFTAQTSAPAASQPIATLSMGPISTYNSINPANQMQGDTFYNCKSDDGFTYLTTDDTGGWQQGGYPVENWTALSLVKFTSESPLAGITVNPFIAYGHSGTATGDDGRSEKDAGLFCMGGKLFMTVGRQLNQATGGMGTNTAYTQNAGQVIWSADKGQSWNNFQNPDSFITTASPTSPQSATMFPGVPGNMGSATFVMYCGDDGTLGYLDACNRTDNADAYIYLMANDGYWDSGNVLFLARVPRAKIARLQPSDYEFYTGGDGTLDTSWTAQQSAAQPVLSNPGHLGEPNVQYLPSRNRYILLTYSYPKGLAAGQAHSEDSLWLAYESPHPWGPWTLVSTTEWPTQGFYNPVILNDTANTDTPTIMFTADFFGTGTYQMYLSKLSFKGGLLSGEAH